MMTSKERWMAAIRMKPVDRLPFWPKIYESYAKAQQGPFCNMTVDEIHDFIGSDKHKNISSCVREIRRAVSVDSYKDNDINRTVYTTPFGEAESIMKYDSGSDSWHPVKYPIETVDDVKIMTAFYLGSQIDVDYNKLEEARRQYAEIGEDAVTKNVIGESPLMRFVELLAGVENAHYLLADNTEEVEELFDAMHKELLRRAEIISEYSPADMIYMMENTSTSLISPSQYRKYCFKHINDYGAIVEQAGKPLILHMCGHLKALLPDLSQVKASAFEAFTSPTLGNTSLPDGRASCPNKCLIGGTNAILWTCDADTIIAKLQEDLNALPHHRGIVVTSAGIMPPMAKPETIKAVCRFVQSYNITL